MLKGIESHCFRVLAIGQNSEPGDENSGVSQDRLGPGDIMPGKAGHGPREMQEGIADQVGRSLWDTTIEGRQLANNQP